MTPSLSVAASRATGPPRLVAMMRKFVPIRESSRGQMVLRLLVFAAALAGLFAMHGLGEHGASSHDMNAPMNPAVMAISHTSQMDSADATENANAADGVPAEGFPGMAMAGLCLAVLAGAVIGLLLLRPPRKVLFLRLICRPFLRTRMPGRRDRDPPGLFELSVLRT